MRAIYNKSFSSKFLPGCGGLKTMKASKFTDAQKAFVVKQGEDQLSDQRAGKSTKSSITKQGEISRRRKTKYKKRMKHREQDW
tara:strand:+ start:385 stop:633 length:249 start_codon:yes stop_codon:yes gene_type:complete